MTRRTAKLTAALALAKRLGIQGGDLPDGLYKTLAERAYAWDSKSQQWAETKRPVRADGTASVSMFSDDNNLPSGVYRLRVMGHPEDMDRLVRELREKLDIFEVSEPYANRKGGGVRIYLSGKLTRVQLRGRRPK